MKLQGSKGGPNLKRARGSFILLPEIILCAGGKSRGLTSQTWSHGAGSAVVVVPSKCIDT